MLVFVDESGHPHPNDRTSRPVVVAVCFEERFSRDISRQLFRLKRNCGKEEMELKAVQLLTRGTFRRSEHLRELVESVFELIRQLPLTIFAVIMERPTREIPRDNPMLPNQYRYLLQRVNLLLAGQPQMAAVLIDGDGSQYGGLHSKFGRFLHRSLEGQLLDKIMDAPFFVDSKITPGIQIADLVAGVVRLYEERNLFRHLPAGDPFLSAVRRFYTAAHERTVDQETIEGFPRHGFYRMPEDHHYRSEPASIAEEEMQESREEEVAPSGEVSSGTGVIITESQQ